MHAHSFAPADVEAALGQRYVVDSQIAMGGQGAVFKATRLACPDGTSVNELVALKLNLYQNQDIRVQREIAAMENIGHPNLGRLIEHGHCHVAGTQTRYLTSEFIDGSTLSQMLKAGRLMECEVLAVGRDVLTAITVIWSRRIVHGDIKPSNIVMRESGGAVLIDLGAARLLEQDNSPAARKPFGTSGYLSPEQARGSRNLTCASDIFSLGVVMLQCLLGRHPTGYDQGALIEGVRASTFRLPVSSTFLGTLDKMLSPNPNFRPTPSGLSGCLQRLQQSIEEAYAMGARAS